MSVLSHIAQGFSGSLDAMTTTIYNKASWLDLSDFETSGAFVVSSGKIQSPNNQTDYIRFGATALNAYIFEVQFKWLANNGGSYLFALNMDSVNTSTLQGNQVLIGATANSGKIVGYRQLSGVTTVSASALFPNVGDVITLRIEKLDLGSHYITATLGSTTISASMDLQHNTAKPTIQACGNTFEIQSLKWYTPYVTPARMVFGDSISVGSNASSKLTTSYAALIGAKRSAGFGDRTAEGVVRVLDITQRVQPKKIFVMLGTNDLTTGVASATWQANLNTIDTATGGTCVFIAPPPNNSADMSAVKNWLAANKAGRYIDCYTPLLGTGTSLNAAYNSGDGVHPNDAGHALIASTIKNNSLYT